MVSSEGELHWQSVQTIPEGPRIRIEEDGRRVGEWACYLIAVFEYSLIQCSRIQGLRDALRGVAWRGFMVECVDRY